MITDTELSKVFDIEPEKNETKTQDIILPAATSDNKIENDFEQSRQNLNILLMQGQDALMGALEVAKQSEHPRAYEVVGNLIKQMADVNQQLMDLHQQKQKLDEPKTDSKNAVTNNNAIFVGSTADLNKLIKNMTKGE
jgi:hypothetical protein